LIAFGRGNETDRIEDREAWGRFERGSNRE
jgi:hypothetical protein